MQGIPLNDSFGETSQRHIAIITAQAVIQKLDKMGFTRAKITVDPDAVVAKLAVLDRRHHAIKGVNDVIGKNILFNLGLDCGIREIVCTDRGVHLTGDVFKI